MFTYRPQTARTVMTALAGAFVYTSLLLAVAASPAQAANAAAPVTTRIAASIAAA
jgi:hypothetical protein